MTDLTSAIFDICNAPVKHPILPEHFPHDYGTDGRCRIEGCNVYDPTEDDDRIDEEEW
jgi:hypothetical protein